MSQSATHQWPDDIVVQDVLTPKEILFEQAGNLKERMRGLVVGDV